MLRLEERNLVESKSAIPTAGTTSEAQYPCTSRSKFQSANSRIGSHHCYSACRDLPRSYSLFLLAIRQVRRCRCVHHYLAVVAVRLTKKRIPGRMRQCHQDPRMMNGPADCLILDCYRPETALLAHRDPTVGCSTRDCCHHPRTALRDHQVLTEIARSSCRRR